MGRRVRLEPRVRIEHGPTSTSSEANASYWRSFDGFCQCCGQMALVAEMGVDADGRIVAGPQVGCVACKCLVRSCPPERAHLAPCNGCDLTYLIAAPLEHWHAKGTELADTDICCFVWTEEDLEDCRRLAASPEVRAQHQRGGHGDAIMLDCDPCLAKAHALGRHHVPEECCIDCLAAGSRCDRWSYHGST